MKRLYGFPFHFPIIGRGGVKRGREREDKQRNVKRKGELPTLEMVVITNIKSFRLDVCWSAKQQKEFKMGDLYGFLKTLYSIFWEVGGLSK